MAIIDITRMPTVETVVDRLLLKTVSAARSISADCLISDKAQITQTIVHLGLELDVQ